MKKVYLLFTDTGTIFTKLIKFYTKRAYNHASICLDEDFQEIYSFGRKNPRNPFIGGFVKEDMRQGLLWNARCKIVQCEVTEEQFQKMKKYIEHVERKKHLYKYNLLGVLAFPFNKQLNRENAFFCSEFVATILKVGEVVSFDKPVSFISPHDLENLSGLQMVYEGKVADLFRTSSNRKNLVLV